MPDALIGPLVWAGVLIPLILWLTWRTERRIRAATGAHLAASERLRAEWQAETDKRLAESQAQSADRWAALEAERTAYEAEQAALDAAAAADKAGAAR